MHWLGVEVRSSVSSQFGVSRTRAAHPHPLIKEILDIQALMFVFTPSSTDNLQVFFFFLSPTRSCSRLPSACTPDSIGPSILHPSACDLGLDKLCQMPCSHCSCCQILVLPSLEPSMLESRNASTPITTAVCSPSFHFREKRSVDRKESLG